MKIKLNKKYMRTQLEALPYIIAALLFCGALWVIVSMLIVICEWR